MSKGVSEYWFDKDAAQLAIDFIEQLHHSKGECAGQRFILQPWQRDLVSNLFGWKRPDGTRRYKKLLLTVGRGGGKTQLAAALGLVMLFIDQDAKPEIFLAAASRDQAGICFQAASDMVNSSNELRKLSD